MKDDDKEIWYVVAWSQEYPELQELIDREMNHMLQLSNFKEANEVISKIKSQLKD
jgi:transcription initiation factor IIE alpha subunit